MVGVLIVFYKDLEHIERLSNALARQSYKKIRIYALDNNPALRHIDTFQKYCSGVNRVKAPDNCGFAGGNNLLAAKALSDGVTYLWVLNPDMEPEPDALAEMVSFLTKNEEYGATGPLLLLGHSKNEKPRVQLYGGSVNFRTQRKVNYFSGTLLDKIVLPKYKEVTLINAGSMLIKADLVKEIGLFEEMYFMYNDEIDIMWRIKSSGYKVSVISAARVWHHHDWSPVNKKGYNLMYYYMMRNKLLYYHKYFGKTKVILSFFREVALFPWALKFCLNTSGFDLFHYYYLGLLHGLVNKKGKAHLSF